MMRLYPNKFPIISKVQNLNLTYAQKEHTVICGGDNLVHHKHYL